MHCNGTAAAAATNRESEANKAIGRTLQTRPNLRAQRHSSAASSRHRPAQQAANYHRTSSQRREQTTHPNAPHCKVARSRTGPGGRSMVNETASDVGSHQTTTARRTQRKSHDHQAKAVQAPPGKKPRSVPALPVQEPRGKTWTNANHGPAPKKMAEKSS